MEIAIALAIVAVAATIVATVRATVTDGYRQVPTNRQVPTKQGR